MSEAGGGGVTSFLSPVFSACALETQGWKEWLCSRKGGVRSLSDKWGKNIYINRYIQLIF